MIYQFISEERYTENSTITRFMLNGNKCVVVSPDDPIKGNPTVWRTEFFEAFDYVDKALLTKGWHICYCMVSNMYGCPDALPMMHEFYEFVTQTFKLSKKPVLFGFSRGGLYAVNYAAQYPDEIGGLYLDAPVCDIHDWPCRDDMNESRERRECMGWYGLTEETLPEFSLIPINKADKIAHLPIIIVAGLVDSVVHWNLNGEKLVNNLKALNANLKVIIKPECDHHPHSLEDPTPVVEFIEANCL